MSPTDHTLPDALRPVVDAFLELLGSAEVGECERQVMAGLMNIGRAVLRERLCALSPREGFVEEGVEWKVAVESGCEVLTLFGPVVVTRPLFRCERNGPTRCFVREKAALIDGLWTHQAAKVSALALVEMPAAQAETFLHEAGIVNASRASLQRMVGYLSDLWEENRRVHEEKVREATEIPTKAVAAAVSLDGVMVMTVDSDRAEVKAAARERGAADKGPAGFQEASVGVISFYDAEGERLATRRYARMPEADKVTTKAWVLTEDAPLA
jgi:hypothetical protein